MTDKLEPGARSRLMARVKNKNTGPELAVRSMVHGLGFRYRLHVKSLPGKPDLVFTSRRKVIYVHGCFWHQHIGCRKATIPETRRAFWAEKLQRNVARDAQTELNLSAMGWEFLVLWECDIRVKERVTQRIIDFLSPSTQAIDPMAIV